MDLYFYNLHLPAEMRVFHVPGGAVRRKDEVAFVYDLRASETRLLRHYSFSNYWFEVNVTLDLGGTFVDEDTPDGKFCFNCDISTPHFYQDEKIVNKDLWLDVLVASDGRTYRITDEEEFAEAQANHWLSEIEVMGARQGLSELQEIIHRTGMVKFLEDIYTFKSITKKPQWPLPMLSYPPEQFPDLIK